MGDIFSGPDNFLAACVPQADPAGLIDKLGERYEIVRTNIKKWTVGSPIQAPLDALELIKKDNAFVAAQVQAVVVRVATQEAVVVNNREMPDICLQHMIAVMLLDGTASFRSAHDVDRMKDPAILRVREKVKLVADEDLDRLLPKRVAIVEVTLAATSPAAGQSLVELAMPREATVVAVLRDRHLVVPRGDTVLQKFDEVIVLVTPNSEEPVRRLLVG